MIRIFNTLSRKKEIFKPIKGRQVGMYTCGPTVYNFAHIGNLRTYIFEDVLRRTLEDGGYKVKHVMNITDVDDKIIRGAKKAGRGIFEFAKPYEKDFFLDLRKLNVKKAWKYPRATKHIQEMIFLIGRLLQKKIAYIADNGVYFSVAKFKHYGKLSGISKFRNIDMLKSRVLTDEYDKAQAQDFALWKFKKSGEPSWKAPFGAGRPGWHIECSAMSMKYLGHTFDIHAGGVDLIFPHHENEIAQSETATGKKFVNYFLEGEHLLVSGEKMSKSLGNIFTLRDIEAKNINPLAYRYFVLGAHYRSKLNFTWEALEASNSALENLYKFIRELLASRNQKSKIPEKLRDKTGKNQKFLEKYKNQFRDVISDDLNTSQALAVVWNLIHDYNKDKTGRNTKILKLLYEFDEVLGLGLKKIKNSSIPQEILQLAQKRERFRAEKNWQKADEIRKTIQKSGYLIKDNSDGPKLSPVSPLSG